MTDHCPAAPADTEQDLRVALLQALALEPCHRTGMHTPDHHLTSLCEAQKAQILDRVLQVLDLTYDELPRRLHEDCGWCHRIPSQEQYRERLRRTHTWAGVPVSAELAAPAPDVPRPGDADKIRAALSDEWQSWQQVTAALGPGEPEGFFPSERYFQVLQTMDDVDVRDISARRRPHHTTADR